MKKMISSVPNASVFRSRKNEAEFWEKHFDQTWTKGNPIKVKFAKDLSATINVRLNPKILNVVRINAEKRGLGPTQLIRTWIMEKVSEDNARLVRV